MHADIRRQHEAGVGRQQPFGMRGAIARRHVGILAFKHDVAVPVDQHRTERMVAMPARPFCDLEGETQKMLIALR